MAEIWAALPSRSGSGSAGWTSVAVVLCTVPLVARRFQPVAVVAVISVGMFALYATVPLYLLFYGTFVPLALAAFSVARYAGRAEPLRCGAAWPWAWSG